ncbi:MAG: GtrA family protein [Anaerolineales bacterium]|jgi:putative flippase GtrA
MNPHPSRLRRETSRFFKFTIVGIIGAVVDFGIFNLLNSILGVWFLLASAVSFTAAVASNFLWNRFWTYPDSRSKPVAQQAGQFALVNLIGLAIRTGILAWTEAPMIRWAGTLLNNVAPLRAALDLFGLAHNATVLGRNLAVALAVIIVMFWNFAINRIWTYSDAP